ncbi:MAG: response regulator [Breznakibacter sp.]
METLTHSIESSQVIDVQPTNATVLLIDNDLASFYLVSEILSEYGINVIHARSGMEGVELVRQKPSIHLVITELLLPQLNGFDVLKEIKRINPEMQVITQTANVMNNMRQNCLEAGFEEFIEKPIDIVDFGGNIISLLNQQVLKNSFL